MVNMPLSLSAFPTKHIRLDNDMNHNINQQYYKWLLKQHNYFPDTACLKDNSEDTIKMEHSYTRDHNPIENTEVITTRTILMERPPPCPQCHQMPPNHDEKVDTPETFNIPIPAYNEESGRSSLEATEMAIQNCQNPNSDTDDWTLKIDKSLWTDQQRNLFERVEHILDMDQLARLANASLSNECLRRNAVIQKSVSRMRLALATVHWEPRLTQWLHGILMTHLSPAYMVSYIEILQTLKRKIPTLVDKMLSDQSIDVHMDYMSAILKDGWEPTVAVKTRTLPSQPVIIVVPSSASTVTTTSREKKWIELLSTLTHVIPIVTNLQKQTDDHKTFDQITEQLIAIVRTKIQEIRLQTPNKHIILVGFNAGAAIAIQVAHIEPVNSIVCLGFAYNTLNGVRGEPDDRILEITAPVLFVLGQNAQQSSQEEIESLREKMSAQTALVVVGSSDHLLRVKRFNRTMEGISQTMIDNMIIDEIQDFVTKCILHPPGPRKPSHLAAYHRSIEENRTVTKRIMRKQAARQNGLGIGTKSRTIRNDGTRNSCKSVSDVDDSEFRRVFESISPNDIIDLKPVSASESNEVDHHSNDKVTLPAEIRRKVIIPSNEFVHIKPPPRNTQKIYVKPHNTSDQTYTLGVNSIDSSTANNEKRLTGSAEKSPMKTITLYRTSSTNSDKMKIINNTSESQVIIDQDDQPTSDTIFENIDLSDIPILFADNDGNLLNHASTVPKTVNTVEITNSEESMEPIDILSAEIIDDSHNAETIKKSIRFDKRFTDSMKEFSSRKSTNNGSGGGGAGGGGGRFVVLNQNTMKHFKNVRHITTHPPNKYRKISFQTNNNKTTEQNGTLANGTRMNISKVVRPTKMVKFIPTNKTLANTAAVQSQSKQTVQFIPKTNTDQFPSKSGILIRKNHLTKVSQNTMNRGGSSTVRRRLSTFHHVHKIGRIGQSGGNGIAKINVKQNKERKTIAENGSCADDKQVKISAQDGTNNSVKALIADLES